ncbi:Acyl carrier protein [Rhizobiales bacterium GAS191]|jgi:acyl carrier protein|nr:Acyl carrier protein [Rhizobiales bacterium GAS113]SED81547.1 Acyl carrier protein [Rhizobiales bacterium GAS191]SEE63712.1 Acyl carrier protein [Rhizobiales bacterium GAS188]
MLDSPSGGSRHRLIGLVRQILEKNSIDRPISVSDVLSEIGLSSIDMVNLMLAVEAEFDLTIPQPELTVENFRSIATIELLVDRLRKS